MQAEKAIEQYLVRCVKQRSGFCVKLTSLNGVPDRLVILPNGLGVCFVELKAPSGVLSDIQKVRIRQLKSMGHRVYVLYNFEQVDNFILKEFKEK